MHQETCYTFLVSVRVAATHSKCWCLVCSIKTLLLLCSQNKRYQRSSWLQYLHKKNQGMKLTIVTSHTPWSSSLLPSSSDCCEPDPSSSPWLWDWSSTSITLLFCLLLSILFFFGSLGFSSASSLSLSWPCSSTTSDGRNRTHSCSRSCCLHVQKCLHANRNSEFDWWKSLFDLVSFRSCRSLKLHYMAQRQNSSYNFRVAVRFTFQLSQVRCKCH